MLLDSEIVPEAAARPRSFVGLMALYESNFLRLLRLVPELERIDGCFRSRVAGEPDLYVDILERCRYTVTLSLTYRFVEGGEPTAKPDMVVRAYLDGQLAEVRSIGSTGVQQANSVLRYLVETSGHEVDRRWRSNMVLNKWLDYLFEQGHLILAR